MKPRLCRDFRVVTCGAVRVLASIILLTAATAKVWTLYHWPVETNLVLDSLAFTFFAVFIEVSIAFWLLLGIWSKTCLAMASLLFLFFSVIAAVHCYRDEPYGCFGAFDVSPCIMFFIDVCIMVLLNLAGPEKTDVSNPVKRTHSNPNRLMKTRIVIGLWVSSLFLASATLLSVDFQSVRDFSIADDRDHRLWLDYENWVGERIEFSRLANDDFFSNEICSGEWTLVFLDVNCRKCDAVAAKIEEAKDVSRVVIIESSAEHASHDVKNVSSFHLSPEVEWFAPVPAIVRVRDGVVIRVSRKLREMNVSGRSLEE